MDASIEAVEFSKDISALNNSDLPRYKDFLFDMILGDQSEKNRKESFRVKIIDRIEQVNSEIRKRDGFKHSEEGSNTPKS